MKETWGLARACTNKRKGTTRRWHNCQITSRPTTEQTEMRLKKPANEGGMNAKKLMEFHLD